MSQHHQFLLALLLATCALAYNVDVRDAILISDPEPSRGYFGFAVAMNGTGRQAQVLVGAPRSNSSYGKLRNIVEAGAFYTCSVLHPTSCDEFIDNDGDLPVPTEPGYVATGKRDHSWLGASIQVENSTNPRVAVCAPRWKKAKTSRYYRREDWYMNGMCYTYNPSNGTWQRHFPLVNDNEQVNEIGGSNQYNHGMGLAGFSVHLTPGSPNFVLGAPGLYRWTGAPLLLAQRFKPNPYDALIPDVSSEPALGYDDYFGYSVTSGYFYRRGERLYASGAPRSSFTLGKVLIFAFRPYYRGALLVKSVMEGEQFGEYFGSSLASCDINNDGRDDLIIGAPQWSKDTDEGRVYAYVSRGQIDFDIQRIDGKQPGGRFGTAVTCLGDLDLDGFADVAVGAPYEESRRGALYILNGAAGGLKLRRQRIPAAEVSPELRGFGVSIAEPRDVDGNYYADVTVGAYLSGHAVVLKSRPVVRLNLRIRRPENFTLMENTTVFFVNACADYDGAFAPDSIKVFLALKIDEFHKRAIVYQNGILFGDTFTTPATLKKGVSDCSPVKITLKRNIQNVIDPIEIIGNVSISEEPSRTYIPVINPTTSNPSGSLKLAFVLDCGDDDLCVSDLRVKLGSDLSGDNGYVIGSKSNVNLSVLVENAGEPAYRAQAHVYIPRPVALARKPPECDEQAEVNKTLELICNLGNPLRGNNSVIIELDMSAIEYSTEFTDIQVVTTTQSEEKDSFDNIGTFRVNYIIDADVTIIGKSSEDLLSYFEKDIVEKNYQKFTFNHAYDVLKFGATPIEEVTFVVNVPTLWRNNSLAKINQIESFIDGQRYDCEHIKSEESNVTLTKFEREPTFYDENSSFLIPPENRTFYANCSNYNITCQKFSCKLGPFIKAQSAAKLTIVMSFQLSNTTEEAVKGKDIIFFVTDGFVEITQPNIKFTNQRPDFKQIPTLILKRFESEEVALWIIILSVLLGIILLALLTLLLFKLGFFNRKRKEDLDNLTSPEKLNKRPSRKEKKDLTAEEEEAKFA